MFGEIKWQVEKVVAENSESGASCIWPLNYDLLAIEVSLENAHNTKALPTLINSMGCKLGRVYADCADDSKARYQLIARKKKVATASIQPHKKTG